MEWLWHKTEDGRHPDGEEQVYVWSMNRARQDPSAEGAYLANTGDPNVENAISYFNVNTILMQNAFDAIAAKPPAAFDRRLYQAAKAHSDDLIQRDAQDHSGQFDRVTASGFKYLALRGNVFAYPYNAIDGHAAWNIDWGYGNGGMQDPPGHRMAIMSVDGNYTNVGIAAVAETNPNTNVGPWVVTGNYAEANAGAPDHYNRFLVGTVWEDLNGNGRYDDGEGLAGVTVAPDQGSYFAVTAAGGGYAIPIDPGAYRVSFSGGDLAGTETLDCMVGEDSVLLDLLYVASQDDYPLRITSIAGPGTVISDPTGIACPSDCAQDYPEGTYVTLTAQPDPGATFDSWGGACSGTDTNCTLAMTQARTVVANFVTQDIMDRSGTDWQVTEIYIATLGYAPDDEGLQYWVDNIETLPAWTPTTVAQSFFDQPLVQERYPAGQGHEALIDALYQNIFGRPADAVGKAYWLGQLASGAVQRNQMIIALINGGWANPDAVLDMQRFGHRVQVGLAFAAEQTARGIRYSRLSAGDQANLRALGAEVIAGVTADPATRDAAIASLPGLFDTYLACVDQCRLGEIDGSASCRLWDSATALWSDTLDDGEGRLHNRARHHTAWLHRWMMPAGGVMAAQFTDDTLNEIQTYGGRRDSAIWTGTYLAAEALRLMSTGAPDAERALSETVTTLHRWWNIPGDPGYLARYAAPADSDEAILALLSAEESEVHRDVSYEGRTWHWRGNISRDQYQGVMLGYSLAYESTQDPTLREIIRSDVVEFVEQLMRSEQRRVKLVIDGVELNTDVTIPYAVFSQADAPNGTPALTLTTSPFEAAGEGVLFFLPNAADLVRQLPGFGFFPNLYQPTQAIQLGAIFNVALQVTEGVPEYAERRQAIADHYAAQADTWFDIAARWRNTNRCDEGYFGLNIGFMPLYNWLRLESDPTRRERLQREVLRDALWAEVADHKNVFFAFIYAALAPEEDDTASVIDTHTDQLARFSAAPNLSRPVDLRSVYAESTSCPGISAEAVNVDERPAATFTWERHPWKLQDAGTPNMTYGGVDYLLAYWMGRHHGFIADDTPETCLLWKS